MGKVYDEPAAGWYRPVGRRIGGRVELTDKKSGDFFLQLDEFLRVNKVKLQELYNAADGDHSGTLDRAEARAVSARPQRRSQYCALSSRHTTLRCVSAARRSS